MANSTIPGTGNGFVMIGPGEKSYLRVTVPFAETFKDVNIKGSKAILTKQDGTTKEFIACIVPDSISPNGTSAIVLLLAYSDCASLFPAINPLRTLGFDLETGSISITLPSGKDERVIIIGVDYIDD